MIQYAKLFNYKISSTAKCSPQGTLIALTFKFWNTILVKQWFAVLCRAMPSCTVLRPMPCCAELYRSVLCNAILYTVQCRHMPCYAVLCRVIPRYAVLCRVSST